MEQELISKKELLELYKISYGALYRWKRKGLIPEDWFIKKATVTGQETFFPRKLIISRVELIQSQKSDVLLDELAHKLCAETRNNKALIINTIYGKKTIYLDDIKSVIIEDKDETKDITNYILGDSYEL